MAGEDIFEVEIDDTRPWTMRKELFDALRPETKASIAAAWKESGMAMPSERELNALPMDQRRELMDMVNRWLVWAGRKPIRGDTGSGKAKRELEVERDADGRLVRARVYG